VPALVDRAFRARISWKGLVKAGTIFQCQCPARRRSQTLMTIRDAVIERSVQFSITEAAGE
jgi:hypothetical protein